MIAKVLRMRVILPPLEMNCLFHKASLFRILSSPPSQTITDLCKAPKGSPKKVVERDPTLQPSSAVNNLTFSTLPTGKISLLFKLMHKPEVASNHSNNQLKKVNCSWESSQKTSISSANSRCETLIPMLSLPLIL